MTKVDRPERYELRFSPEEKRLLEWVSYTWQTPIAEVIRQLAITGARGLRKERTQLAPRSETLTMLDNSLTRITSVQSARLDLDE